MKAISPAFFSISTILAGCVGTLAELALPTATTWPVQSFRSSPLQPPYLNVTKLGQTELGYLFIAPRDSSRNTTTLTIYSDDGQLVWQSEPNETIFSVRPQMLHGEPVITYWSGNLDFGFGWGSITILNSSYQEIAKVTLPNTENNYIRTLQEDDFPSYIDIHEDMITEEGTMLVNAVNVTQADLTSVGGPKDGWVQDALVYEIDIETNEVLFKWSAFEHVKDIPMAEAHFPLGDTGKNSTLPWEYAHLNSVVKYGDKYLVSARYLCGVYLIGKNGDLIWKLHGLEGGDFTLGIASRFCFQHTPRFRSLTADNATLTLFNNDNTRYTGSTSFTTGLVLDLDFKTMKATLNQKMWDTVDPAYSQSQGSFQDLDNGHVLLGYGNVPKIVEFDEQGAVVMRARFGHDEEIQGYRSWRAAWVGTPKTKPSVVACPSERNGKTEVFVSWNGATDIEAWKVLADEGDRTIKTVPKNGFETRILLDGKHEKVAVEAVGGPNRKTRSEVVTVGDGC